MSHLRHALVRPLAAALAVPLVVLTGGAVSAGASSGLTGGEVALRSAIVNEVTITSPANGAVVPAGEVVFTGTAAPSSSVAMSLSGPGSPGDPGWDGGYMDARSDENGSWTMRVDLDLPGDYLFTARNVDSTSSDRVVFTVQ